MTRRRRTLRAELDRRRGCAEAAAPPLTLQRKAEVAESIVLALSSGLYDYTSCSNNKVSTKATGIDNPLTADTQPCCRGLGAGLSLRIDPEDARNDEQACQGTTH